ncbi:hypothetical protein C7T94_13000 [Pedobacter yulinensis]|uniref:Uncharacterized protein n=1 Tax=Pedobacter yulinensis TaxID=2126353 RepID=A0A2T3HM17_9SPHI|nr:hypothetical protein [Pedobacter yulinensis]PST83474.1 hypothetical protein C7T94_13000 [Pedobacter yulinensis]
MSGIKIAVLIALTLLAAACRQSSASPENGGSDQTLFWKQGALSVRKLNETMEYPVKKEPHIAEKRIHRIYIDNMACQFEVFVDDVLLLRTMGEITRNGGGMNGDHDINQLLLSPGKHEVKVRMYPKFGQPVFGDEGYVNLKFSHFTRETFRKPVYDPAMNSHNGIQINQADKQWIEKWDHENQVGYEGDYVAKQPDRFKGLQAYEWRRTFDAELPFAHTGWRESVNLQKEQDDEDKNIRREVLEISREIHAHLSARDAAAYLKLVTEREELITQTLFYRDNEKKLREQEFVKLIRDEAYELQPLLPETCRLDYQGYGKLVALVNNTDGEGAIRFKNRNDPNDVIYMDFRFQRKHKGSKLSVI